MKSLAGVLVTLAATGCSAGSGMTGGGSARLIGLNDVCTAQPPSGYLNPNNQQFVASPATGADLLALVAGPYTGTYVPQGVPPGYTWHGSLSPSALTANVEYMGGAAHCSGLECSCDPPGPCSVDRCGGPFVSVDVIGTFVTADGTFDEQVDGALSALNGAGGLDFDGTLPATALHGSYEISFGPASAVSLDFDAQLSAGHATGGISEVTSSISGGGGAIQ